jgi:hypothetical protein
MSDLFLDTEVRWDIPFIARRCAESEYNDETLERIFWIEVFPEAIGNMLQVAGEWAALALDETALIQRANAGKMPWLARRVSGWMVQSEWEGTCAVTRWLRPLEEPRRTQFVQALRLCGRRYFEIPDTPLPHVSTEAVHTARHVLTEAWQFYEPVCRSMLQKNEAPTHEARAAAVQQFLLHALRP